MSSGKGVGWFTRSRRGLAVPVTYLILLGSLIVLVSVTYGFAAARINAKGAVLGVAVAKQNMQALDDAIRLVAWNTGAAKTVFMEDCGSVFQVQPNAKNLVLRLMDGGGFSSVVFNGSMGKVLYTFSALPENQQGFFVRGDGRAIVGYGASTMAQLYFERDGNVQQLVLCYRPMMTALATSLSNGGGGTKPVNVLRLYILNVSIPQPLALGGSFKLKVSTINVASTLQVFTFEGGVSSLAIEALSENAQTTVHVPLESSMEGAVVNLETYICHITIQVVSS
ncbi:MAG: hypothetical protein QXY07_01760 [Candidatus Bathyarchaeia archaeon]